VAKDLSIGEIQGFGVRVLDKVWGFASSNRAEELLNASEMALKAAKRGKRKIPFEPRKGIEDKVRTKAKIDPSKVDLEDKVSVGIRAYDSLRGDELVVSSSFAYVDSTIKGFYANSEGTNIDWESKKVAFFASVFAKKNGTLQFGSERIGATAGFEFLGDPEAAATKAKEKAIRLLSAKNAPSGRFTVVLDPLLTGVFIHEALGHAVEADHVIQGDSILENKIGETITSELITVYDDPTIEGSFGFYHYDSEGTPSQKTQLIKNGVLTSYLHSRETSSALNMENTSNARSQSFEHLPVVRMSNTFLEPRKSSFEELIEDIDYGVFLMGSKGGEVDPAKGVFQFSAEEGILIEGGKVTTPIKDVALSGETLKILKDIDAVGREFDSHIGFCGKESQAVPVGDGGAHIRTLAAVGGTR
jgi:TldD protein